MNREVARVLLWVVAVVALVCGAALIGRGGSSRLRDTARATEESLTRALSENADLTESLGRAQTEVVRLRGDLARVEERARALSDSNRAALRLVGDLTDQIADLAVGTGDLETVVRELEAGIADALERIRFLQESGSQPADL